MKSCSSALRPTSATTPPSAASSPAAGLFEADENVRVLHGDWHELMPPEAPFDLLFYDGGGKQRADQDGEEVVDLLAPGATIVMNDLTPGRWGHDVVRQSWLNHPEI